VSRVQKIEDAVREYDSLRFGTEPFNQGERFELREHRKPVVPWRAVQAGIRTCPISARGLA